MENKKSLSCLGLLLAVILSSGCDPSAFTAPATQDAGADVLEADTTPAPTTPMDGGAGAIDTTPAPASALCGPGWEETKLEGYWHTFCRQTTPGAAPACASYRWINATLLDCTP